MAASGSKFPTPGLSTITATGVKGSPTSNQTANNTLGFYGQEEIALNDRLFIAGALRVDNNSAFGSKANWVQYPKLSLSWVASEEPAARAFIPKIIEDLRFRFAFGGSGQQPGVNTALRTFTPVAGPGSATVLTPVRPARRSITSPLGAPSRRSFIVPVSAAVVIVLLALVVAGLIPSGARFSALLNGTIFLVYLVPILLWDRIEDREFFVVNCVLFSFVLGACIVVRWAHRRHLEREIALRDDLTRSRERLEAEIAGHLQTGAALRENREFLASITAAAMDAIVMIDAKACSLVRSTRGSSSAAV